MLTVDILHIKKTHNIQQNGTSVSSEVEKYALPLLVGEKSLLVSPNMLRIWRIHEPSRNKKMTGKLNVLRLALHFIIARAFSSTGAYE